MTGCKVFVTDDETISREARALEEIAKSSANIEKYLSELCEKFNTVTKHDDSTVWMIKE